jgi:hypothetical protein
MCAAEHEPLISICIPTHHGRDQALAALLEAVVHQARSVPGLVEICVSDNASRDGTAKLLAELASSASCRVTYSRQSKDVGLARNLLAAVELASSRYCWLLGSDDLLAAGAVERVCELLGELPDATGYVVGAVHVDAEDPRLRSRQLPRAFHPPEEEAGLIEGLDAVYDACGNAWCALSWSIVDREAWLQAAREHRDLVLAHPVFPQVIVLARMAAQRPLWGWFPEPLVHQRNATTFLFEQGNVSLADRWSQIIGGVAAAWGAALGRRGGTRWRRRMRLLNRVWGGAEDMRAIKLYGDPPIRSQAQLGLVCFAAFWPVCDYWQDVLPATLMPAWLTRARYAPDGRWPPGARKLGSRQIALSGRLPCRMFVGGAARVRIAVRNGEGGAVPSAGRFAVTLGQRWLTAEDVPLGPDELGLNDLAAMPQTLPGPVREGRTRQVEVALLAPREPGIYRVELAAQQHGRGWLDEAGVSPALVGSVEIVSRDASRA